MIWILNILLKSFILFFDYIIIINHIKIVFIRFPLFPYRKREEQRKKKGDGEHTWLGMFWRPKRANFDGARGHGLAPCADCTLPALHLHSCARLYRARWRSAIVLTPSSVSVVEIFAARITNHPGSSPDVCRSSLCNTRGVSFPRDERETRADTPRRSPTYGWTANAVTDTQTAVKCHAIDSESAIASSAFPFRPRDGAARARARKMADVRRCSGARRVYIRLKTPRRPPVYSLRCGSAWEWWGSVRDRGKGNATQPGNDGFHAEDGETFR